MLIASRRPSALNVKPVVAPPVEKHNVPDSSSSFPGRDGYEPGFLGQELALPSLSADLQKTVAPLLEEPTKSELKYTHFSVIMSKMRRLPILTAVNIDGAKLKSVPRRDNWVTDSRIRREHQMGNEAYKHNDLDRGHMVRRLDPVWGEKAQQANDDTFVYTNSALQHKDLNRREWVALEEHILSHARTTDQKMTVFTGPVFSDSDPAFDNDGRVSPPTQIPQQFWKVAVWNNPKEGLQGTAFVLSQEELVDPGDFKDGKFDPGRFQVYQVPLQKLEEMADIDFGEIADTTTLQKAVNKMSDVDLGSAALETPVPLPDREPRPFK